MDKNTSKSSFGKWINPINLENLAEPIQKADRYVKKCSFESYLKLMVYAHLEEVKSLHALKEELLDDQLQKELGFESLSISQVSRKHRAIDTDLLAAIFADLALKMKSTVPMMYSKPLYILDSSTISLNLEQHGWAHFRKTKAGVKLHLRLVFMNDKHSYPDEAVITPAKEHDRNQLDVLIDEKEAIYVFDRGYLDFERFDQLCEDGYTFLTRIKKNTVITPIEYRKVAVDSPTLSDTVVLLGASQKQMAHPMRVIEVEDTKGNFLRLTTNDLETSAETIAEMYRKRWQIELFFRWVKQHVRIEHFYGRSETAIQNQVYLALIVYCLLVLTQEKTKSEKSTLTIARRLKKLMWKSWKQWEKTLGNIP
ncbi:IS4 family transposase [Halobacillus shinanisalinarum]|uniref:IS4 family transposase n=1 Tax=Halobacillus shinanisalinarum TaxID=2932258 RepID=A0ABY4GUS3_9BACI|nr:IS4 family transposase [Halobacillus shinanisalinarum]UOQ91915.1 IS4 family transposase [Halobacillus shinanisalinarum]